jgi:4-aminobutyrate aminotransferase-like enzyme/Ser/Thr protein kinase RdoA (MazF antagonist)
MALSASKDLPFTIEEVEQLAKKYYGLTSNAKALAGEVDYNFRLKAHDGRQFTLKISRQEVDIEDLDFQFKIMDHLLQSLFPYQVPAPISNLEGELITKFIDSNNIRRYIRLQKWVEGEMIEKVNPRDHRILEEWGRIAGHLSKALQHFSHPAAHKTYKWDPSNTLEYRHNSKYITDEASKACAEYFWEVFENKTLPVLPELRKSVNYNDAHEHNILVNINKKGSTVRGVIDFGDALYTHTINELAITCAYACMKLPDPLDAAAHVVKAYHHVFPLMENEISVLYSMISARLLLTVAHAASNRHLEPDNKYLQVSEQPAWDLLKKWRNVSPELAHYTFRKACGLTPCPDYRIFHDWIINERPDFNNVIPSDGKKCVPIDLSVGSLDLGNNSRFDNIKNFVKTIDRFMEDQEADICYGGYGEVRPVYTTDAYQTEGYNGAQWRSTHIGLDFWTDTHTAVYAPWPGIVHSKANNVGDCNYGPTIILEHNINDNLTFYTLYGHLKIESLEGVEEGEYVEKGQEIAQIGFPPSNGNWPPHLHFQVILDLLGEKGDFPGVAFPHEKKVWFSICPDPALLFPEFKVFDHSTDEVLSLRQKHLAKSLSISYNRPLHIVRGYRQYLYDDTARRYLDTVNNVAHVGHEHPGVVSIAQKQIGLLNTNTRYLHANVVKYAEELLATFPPELEVVFFVNSGSEANELALRIVRANTGSKHMMAVEVGYHGNTGACIDISSYKFDGKGGSGAPDHTHILPIPDVYRGIYKEKNNPGKLYADHARSIIEKLRDSGQQIGGFIAESILSCGGQIMLPDRYLSNIYHMVRNEGGLCIADEVQVGFGRVGEYFWGFELQGVVPDIVTLGKPIGNGHPLGAVVTTRAAAEAFANGMEYFNTFGGNPVSCAIGSKVLQIIKDEDLQAHAKSVGKYLTEQLLKLKAIHPIIGDVRGVGLFQGIELVKELSTLTPAADEATYVSNRMRDRSILMSTDGPYHNVLKIKPPMCFSKDNVDFLIENLDVVLSENFISY